MEPFPLLGFEISGGAQFASIFIVIIAIVANAKLFVKAGLPWWAVFVPVYNIMVAMKLIGRPTWHAFLFFTPALVYLLPRTILEVAQSFGKHKTIDFILVLLFNIFYILNLGLSYEEEYVGPVYGNVKSSNKINSSGGINIAH
jgi:signal peptidase I